MDDSATELAIDLFWFLDGQAWKPEMYPGQQKELEYLALKLPCSVAFISDQNNRESDQVKAWQTEVRGLMKDLGFYAGSFKSPDKKYFLKKLQAAVLSFQEPKGAAAYVFVAVKDCKSTNDPARCAYANEARVRKNRQAGGILIEVKDSEGVPDLWKKLRREAKNNRIVSLQFFDHGTSEQQVVGGDRLTSASDIPRDIASRFSATAEITMYGCTTMRGDRQQAAKQSALATHLRHSLLYKGGRVIGFRAFVELDTEKMRMNEPKPEDRVVFDFPACDGSQVIREIIQLMKSMKGKFKVKYAQTAPEQTGETVVADLLDYPGDYPNEGYYA